MKVATALCCGALVMVAGCMPTIWNKPDATPAEVTQDKGRCSLIAQGMNPGGFYAQGKPAFVAAAAVVSIVGTAIDREGTFNNCMLAAGYTPTAPAPQSVEAPVQLAAADRPPRLRPGPDLFWACWTDVYNSPDLAPLRARIPRLPTEATPEQLADRSLVNEHEKAAIVITEQRLGACRKSTGIAVAEVLPDTAGLRRRGLTWGQYNMRRKGLGEAAQERLATALR